MEQMSKTIDTKKKFRMWKGSLMILGLLCLITFFNTEKDASLIFIPVLILMYFLVQSDRFGWAHDTWQIQKARTYHTGDFVYFKGQIMKIMGQGGDEVYVQDDRLLINGQFVARPYQNFLFRKTAISSQTIPDGHVFLMIPSLFGNDSRLKRFGLIPVKSLEGKAIGMDA